MKTPPPHTHSTLIGLIVGDTERSDRVGGHSDQNVCYTCVRLSKKECNKSKKKLVSIERQPKRNKWGEDLARTGKRRSIGEMLFRDFLLTWMRELPRKKSQKETLEAPNLSTV